MSNDPICSLRLRGPVRVWALRLNNLVNQVPYNQIIARQAFLNFIVLEFSAKLFKGGNFRIDTAAIMGGGSMGDKW